MPDRSAAGPSNPGENSGSDFIRDLVAADTASGRFGGRVQTRFPPEPNGYLHIGHAKAICLDFTVAAESGGRCFLRFDDTNPATESPEYVDAIIADVAWLGFEPQEIRFASDYFDQLYDWAELLISRGLAYVDDQDAEAISAGRGGFGQPGTDSPFRDRPVDENLRLFREMAVGQHPQGSRVLRARIDMQHENMQMRDPVMYRIRHQDHYRQGDRWCIYPTYDWAHGQGDAIEGVTHSLCTLEFRDNRALYDWYLEHLPLAELDYAGDRPHQTEFARLELTNTITSKRVLRRLVEDGHVDGWDDPRLPTLRALRRRGYPPAAIRDFCGFIGVARTNSRHAPELLESFVRTELNAIAPRRMAVLRPLKLVITNWPTDDDGNPLVEYREAVNNPEDQSAGTRQVPFSGELWIEQDDFRLEAPPKYFRLAPGREVRLRAGYFVRCIDAVTDAGGRVTEVRCTYDPETSSGQAPDGRKVKATIHWVSAAHAVPIEAALYERLFDTELPGERTGDPLDDLHPNSREVCTGVAEPAVTDIAPGQVVQFERLGYFCADNAAAGNAEPGSSAPRLFHRTVGLRDEWANIQKRRQQQGAQR
ncbi:glutamine--tRNA ligase/YqeY domain fusion protein [Candidatus Poriferisodalis multihospitum]|uniref:glutamine--tRNA ligase/YqeY domain fusion protein n=1 Tax=Candidatus Poriferisodalis multihospitum TaxID=2983191 RepID=UPI00238970E4|nr:glutamine--tRNA ligase/YqeY domain fusion protein [Candidatus Poriferisodalis multihospitum]MDE0318320.1 glutamine--tRNA ligase/YqeY domain fusion protein [Acidimicrobiaceae bacterium]